MKKTGMTHKNCGGIIMLYTKTLWGVTGTMYICNKFGSTVEKSELQMNPIAPQMANRSSLIRQP